MIFDPRTRNRRALGAAIGAISLLAVAGCASPIPTVDIVSASPEALDSADDARDDLTFVLAYADGDGDLGGGSVMIHDCRAEGLVTEVPIPTIANEDGVRAGVSIEGELTVVLADIGVVPAAPSPAAACADLGVGPPAAGAQAFCVVLVDAEGHESDGACTAPIAVE